MSECQTCSAPTADGAQLCRTHVAELTALLTEVTGHNETIERDHTDAHGRPVHRELRDRHGDPIPYQPGHEPITADKPVPGLATELDVTATRQDRLTPPGDSARGRHGRPLMFKEHAADVRIDLNTTLNAWALEASQLGEDERDPLRPIHHSDTVGVADWLRRNLHRLAHHEHAGTAHDELRDCVERARRAVDQPATLIYLGACDQCPHGPDDPPTDLYAHPHAVRVTCPACATEVDVAHRRDWLLKLAEDQLLTATECSRALPNLLDAPLTAAMVRGYAHRGKLPSKSPDPRDPRREPRYRVGDLLAVLADIRANGGHRPGAGRACA